MIRGDDCDIAHISMLLLLAKEYLMRWKFELLTKPYGSMTEGPIYILPHKREGEERGKFTRKLSIPKEMHHARHSR